MARVQLKNISKAWRGVAAVPFGWWDAAHGGAASANDLTSDAPTDMGGGVAYHDTFVDIARI